MRRNLGILVVALVAAFAATSLLSGCNTTAGAGRDLSATGHAITRAAEENK